VLLYCPSSEMNTSLQAVKKQRKKFIVSMLLDLGRERP
jgi:hypothetical protein